jgi:hypothetical protein
MVFTEDVIPTDNSKSWSHEIRLSTAGLSNAIDGVLKSCDEARAREEPGSSAKR